MDRVTGGLDRWRSESKDEPRTDQGRCGRNQWRRRRTEEGTTGGWVLSVMENELRQPWQPTQIGGDEERRSTNMCLMDHENTSHVRVVDHVRNMTDETRETVRQYQVRIGESSTSFEQCCN